MSKHKKLKRNKADKWVERKGYRGRICPYGIQGQRLLLLAYQKLTLA